MPSDKKNSVSNSLCITDESSGLSFLVDTGAEVSIIPFRGKSQAGQPSLVTATGQPIRCYGSTIRKVRFSNQPYTHKFLLADVTTPIIGADFLRTHGLLVDLRNKVLLDVCFYKHYSLKNSAFKTLAIRLVSNAKDCPYKNMLQSFPELTSTFFKGERVEHGVKHTIETTGPPVFAHARRLDTQKLLQAKEEFETMHKLGIIRKSKSPWSSPLHMVPKPNGKWRPCGDYRRLNNNTIDDRYPLPHIHDFNAQLQNSRVYSKIDLVRGYHQIPMSEESIPKTAIITPFGLWEYLRMPFGLKNAAQSFQRMMDGIIGDLPFVFCYLDDLLVASETEKEHEEHVRTLFERLNKNGLIINPDKCLFGVTSLDFLGHTVNSEGIVPPQAKVEAIRNFPLPKDMKELQRFLGMINFYHRFVPNMAYKLQVLQQIITSLTKKKGNPPISWDEDQIKVFDSVKTILADAVMLVHPHKDALTSINVDASDTALGASLQQRINGMWRPLAFFSRKLSAAEKNYSAYDRELLAIYAAIRHFRYFIEGRKFVIYTDHKPLTYALSAAVEKSPRQQRHLSFIAEFCTDIRHVAGMDNVVADSLSRIAAVSIDAKFNYTELAEAQNQNENKLKEELPNLTLKWKKIQGIDLLCDVGPGGTRLIVPEELRYTVFCLVHNVHHPGVRASVRETTSKFVWKGIAKDITTWARQCHKCATAKIQSHVKSPFQRFEIPKGRFEHVHVDIVGPLPRSKGMAYLLTIIDRFTRWPEAVPIQDISATTVCQAFMATWVARYGVPISITSDRGTQFTSQLWSSLGEVLGCEMLRTTAYHPQANGLVERFHRSLKAALTARGMTNEDWTSNLPVVLLGLRNVYKPDIGASSAQLTYGQSLALPAIMVDGNTSLPSPNKHFLNKLFGEMRALSATQTAWHRKVQIHVPKELRHSNFVYVRQDATHKPLAPRYKGPFRVLERGEKVFYLEIEGQKDSVSIDRLKPAFVSADSGAATRSGRVSVPPRPL